MKTHRYMYVSMEWVNWRPWNSVICSLKELHE